VRHTLVTQTTSILPDKHNILWNITPAVTIFGVKKDKMFFASFVKLHEKKSIQNCSTIFLNRI
jgi:hypothetical protein